MWRKHRCLTPLSSRLLSSKADRDLRLCGDLLIRQVHQQNDTHQRDGTAGSVASSRARSGPHAAAAEAGMSRERLHVMLLSLAQAASRQPTRSSSPTLVTPSPPQQQPQSPASGVVGKSEDAEATSSDAPHSTTPREEEDGFLKRLLMAKRAARPRVGSPRAPVSSSSSTAATAAPASARPDGGSAPEALAAPLSASSSAWQEALRLFFDAVHDHAVTPTAQHFNLLLQLTAQDGAWNAVDHVEEYYARFLATVGELREGKERAVIQARRRAAEADLLADEKQEEEEAQEEKEQEDPSISQGSVSAPDASSRRPVSTLLAQQNAIATLRRQVSDLEAAEAALRPNSRTFHLLMRVALSRGRWPLVLEYFDNMRDMGLGLTDETLQYVLEAFLLSVSASSLSGPDPAGQTRREGTDQEDTDSVVPSPLRAVLQAANRGPGSDLLGLDSLKSLGQRLATNQRGPQLRAAAQAAPSASERAQAEKRRQELQAQKKKNPALGYATAAFTLVRDFCHLVTQPRTVWLMISILQRVHSPDTSRRIIDVYQLFPHILRPARLSIWLPASSSRITPPSGGRLLRLADSSSSRVRGRDGAQSASLLLSSSSLASVEASDGSASGWVPPHPSWASSPSLSVTRPVPFSTASSEQLIVWSWLAVSVAAHDIGDWVVARELCDTSVSSWRADSFATSVRSFSSVGSEYGGLAEAQARARTRESFLIDVVQPLLVNALHALRRVRRYSDILALYQQQYVPVLEALEAQAERPSMTPDALLQFGPNEAALFWSTPALVLVAQSATALQRQDVLMRLIACEGRVVSQESRRSVRGAASSLFGWSSLVPLPSDVYESSLRTYQVQCVLEKHQREEEGGVEKGEGKSRPKDTTRLPSRSTEDVTSRAEQAYQSYLDAARHQMRLREEPFSTGASVIRGCPLLTREHEPLLRALVALTPNAAPLASSRKAPWQEAVEYFALVRRPDALQVTLLADILLTTVRQARRATTMHMGLVMQLGEAARRVLDRLLKELPSDVTSSLGLLSSPSQTPAPLSDSWQHDATAEAHARLQARLKCVYVTETAMERLLTALLLGGRPVEIFTLVPSLTSLAWVSEATAARLTQRAQDEALEKTRADLRRAQDEEQQIAPTTKVTQVTPTTTDATGVVRKTATRVPPVDTAVRLTDSVQTLADTKAMATSVSSERALVQPHSVMVTATSGGAGRATELLMVLIRQSSPHTTERPGDDNDSAASVALRRVVSAAVLLVQHLQSAATTTATAAFCALLDRVDGLHRLSQSPPAETVHLTTGSPFSPQLVLPIVVDAVIEQVGLSTPHRCTLWPHCLRLLTVTLGSPFTPTPFSECVVVPVSSATLPLLRRFVRYCDRAESEFVERLVLEWLRPGSLRVADSDQTRAKNGAHAFPGSVQNDGRNDEDASSGRVQGWGLALDALVWACRRREKVLAKAINQSLFRSSSSVSFPAVPHDEVLSWGPTSFHGDLAQHVVAAHLALLQCLTSGRHEDVREDWPVIEALFAELLCVSADAVAQLQHSPAYPAPKEERGTSANSVFLSSPSEVFSLVDALVAVFVKVQKTVHHLLTKAALDTHRLRCACSVNPHIHSEVIARTEAMARAFHQLMGPTLSDDLAESSPFPPPQNGGARADVSQRDPTTTTTPRTPQLIPDVLLPLCASSPRRIPPSRVAVDPLQTQRILLLAVHAAWDVLYTEYVWLTCFKYGHVLSHLLRNEEARTAALHARMTRLLQLHVEFCAPSPVSTDTHDPWLALRHHLTLWCVVSAHSAVSERGGDGGVGRPTTVARVCNHLTTLEAFLGARAVTTATTVIQTTTRPSPSSRSRTLPSGHDKTIPILFLEVVQALSAAIVAPVTPAASGASSLPPMSDGSSALSRFQSPVSLLRPHSASLALLHDAALHLLYAALCEESIPHGLLLHPMLSAHAKHASRTASTTTRTTASATRRHPAEVILPFAETGLLPSALTWCCGANATRYADVLRAAALFLPSFVGARCLKSSVHVSPTAQAVPSSSSAPPVSAAEAIAEDEELMIAVLDRMASLRVWRLSCPSTAAPGPQVETLVAALLSAPRDLYGEHVRVTGSLLSESVAASALVALSLTTTASIDGVETTAAARLARQQAERILTAFPMAISRVCLPRWASSEYTSTTVTAVDALCAMLWSRPGEPAAVHRAVLTWFLAVHGTWPTHPSSSADPVTLDGQHGIDLAVLAMEAFGGLKAPLEEFLAGPTSSSSLSSDPTRTRRPRRAVFAWQAWQTSLTTPAAHTTAALQDVVTTVPDVRTAVEARVRRCMTAVAAVQLIETVFGVSVEQKTSGTTWSEEIVDLMVACAGTKLSAEQKEKVRRTNEARRVAAAEAEVQQQQHPQRDIGDVVVAENAASVSAHSVEDTPPVVTLVRALIGAVKAHTTQGIDQDTLLRAVRNDETVQRAITTPTALADWTAFHHALTISAPQSRAQDDRAQLAQRLTRSDVEAMHKAVLAVELAMSTAATAEAQEWRRLGDALFFAIAISGVPLSVSVTWLHQSYIDVYRPALAHANSQVCTAWSRFVADHVRTLFLLYDSLSHSESEDGLEQDDVEAASAWSTLLHILALDLVGLDLTVTTSTKKRKETATAALVRAREALLDIHAHWSRRLSLPALVTTTASATEAELASLRAWATLCVVLGAWREPLHLFKSLAALTPVQTALEAREEACDALGGLAMLVLCASAPHGGVAPAALHALLDGLGGLEVGVASASLLQTTALHTHVATTCHVVISLDTAIRQSLPSRSPQSSSGLDGLSVSVRVCLAAPLVHALRATQAHRVLRDLFVRAFIGEPHKSWDMTAKTAAWAALVQQQAHGTAQSPIPQSQQQQQQELETQASASPWTKVHEAVRVLSAASEDTLRAFVAHESRRRRPEEARTDTTTADDVLAGQSSEAAKVKGAWMALADGLVEVSLRTKEGSDREAETVRVMVLDVLTSPPLAVIPHSVHFIPLRLSESLIHVACGSWQEAMRLLRFSLSTLHKTQGRPTPVQQYMVFLILQRVRLDAAFAAHVGDCEYAMPSLFAEKGEGHTLHGGPALAAACFELVALPTTSTHGAHDTPILPQRVLMEIVRHAAPDLALTESLYVLFWQQPYKRLEGPHAFLSLLRAARLNQRGDVGLRVMADFFTLTGTRLVVPVGSVLPPPHTEVVAWSGRIPVTSLSREAYRVVWKAFARLCEAHLVTTDAAEEVLDAFRTTGMLTDVEELLVTVFIESPSNTHRRRHHPKTE